MLKNILKKASVLLTGTALGQILNLLALPLLTRIYAAEQFGIFGVFAGFLYLFSCVASMRYEVAIPIVKKRSESYKLFFTSGFLIIIFCSFLFILLILPFGNNLTKFDFLGIVIERKMVFILIGGIFLNSFYNGFINIALSQSRHKTIAKAVIVQSGFCIIAQVVLSKTHLSNVGLLLGQLIGIMSGLLTIAFFINFRGFSVCVGFWGLWRTLVKYKKFPKYDVISNLFAIANNHGTTLIVSFLFGAHSAGIFVLVQRMIIAPFGILSNALSSALLGEANKFSEGEYISIYTLITKYIFFIPLFLMLTAILAYYTFPLFVSNSWESSGAVAALIILFIGYKFLFDSILPILAINEHQKLGAKMQIGIFFFRNSSLFFAGYFLNFIYCLLIFSLISSFLYIYSLLLIFSKKIVINKSDFLKLFASYIFSYCMLFFIFL